MMPSRIGPTAAVMALVLMTTAHGRARSLEPWLDSNQKEPFAKGQYQFILTGASMSDSEGVEKGVRCLKPEATATIEASKVPSRPTLEKAVLYVAGSLIEDNLDFQDPPLSIFSSPGLEWDIKEDRDELHALAIREADKTVEFQPPGAVSPITVQGDPEDTSAVVYLHDSVPGSGESGGDVAFAVTAFDVTEVIGNQGEGVLAGTYRVGGFQADVCDGLETVCDPSAPDPPACAKPHSRAVAAFALLLIVKDSALPLTSIAVFDGLSFVFNSVLELDLTLPRPLTDPTKGTLAFFALEGDLAIGRPVADQPPCNAGEYIYVHGKSDSAAMGLCLEDTSNPKGNLFNSTLNIIQAPAGQQAHACAEGTDDVVNCCNGDVLCGEKGVDLDQFNVSAALDPGETSVRLTVGSGLGAGNSDRVALALVVMQAELYGFEFDVEEQVRVIGATDGHVRLGAPFEYSIAVSNVGNKDATDVSVVFRSPPGVEQFALVDKPEGANDEVTSNGSVWRASVVEFNVPAGKVGEVRVRMHPPCTAAGKTLAATVTVKAKGLQPEEGIELPVPTLAGAGPGIEVCDGVDPFGFFADPDLIAEKKLRGGRCSGGQSSLWGALLAIAFVFVGRRRVRVVLLRVPFLRCVGYVVACWAVLGCSERHKPAPPPESPPVRHIESLEGLPGELCGSPWMVWVRPLGEPAFCIDRFEAAVDDGERGYDRPDTTDEDRELDSSATVQATHVLGEAPATLLTWYQAQAACVNVGKRLCTKKEWEYACRGRAELLYPYGNSYEEGTCNGHYNMAKDKPSVTGSLQSCGSEWGVYDMSGNVEEWLDDSVPREPGETKLLDRAFRGGSYRSNRIGLSCVGEAFHADPGAKNVDRGFRCCTTSPSAE